PDTRRGGPAVSATRLATGPGAMSRGRRTAVSALAVLLLVAVLAGCAVVTPAGPADGATAPPPAASGVRALILGDSYTEGRGAVPLTEGYAYQVGARLGWDVTVSGVGGSGYLNPGPQLAGDYRTRLAAQPATPMDVVVLQGSSNDSKYPLEQLVPAVQATVAAVRARYPAARLLILGPVALYGQPIPAVAAVHDQLRAYALAHDITFIDPIEEAWFVRGESRVVANPENGHPSNVGHARIADLFVRDVQRSP
ncbi:MAG: lipolytic protein family, partial [Friedmanniella sp.]|nr:lipolytic protein family [Friedmanniella sp.]